MSRLAVLLLLLFVTVESASAQMVMVVFRDRKIEKKYARYLSKVDGIDALVGEAKEGIRIERGVVNYAGGDKENNELWVPDPSSPEKVPYRWDKGVQVLSKDRGKGGVVAFAGDEVQAIKKLDPLGSLLGYAGEYTQRVQEIDALAEQQKGEKKGSKVWFALNGRIVGSYLRIQSWLENIGFSKAAENLEKEITKRRKQMAKDAGAAREQEALASVKKVETPPELTAAAKEISGGRVEFHVQESRHMRITYVTDLSDDAVTAGLELVEKIVEGFRQENVDPYLDEDFEDRIPDDAPIVEFYFGPAELAEHERYLIDYYKHAWGRYKEQEMAASGALFYRDASPQYLYYRKYYPDIDFPGYLAHGIGVALADVHYNQGRRNDAQPWLNEASGYHAAISYLGRNNITTFSDGMAKYAESKGANGAKTRKTGLRGFYNQEARAIGVPIEGLAPKELYQLGDADFSKGWSFLDFVMKRLGKEGQVWLRRTCDAAVERSKFVVEWRKVSEEIFPQKASADVFAQIEQQWRKWAETEQILELDPTK